MSASKRRYNLSRQSLVQYTHSIRFRLVLWFVLILGLVLLLFSAFVYWRQARDLRSIAINQLNYTLERYLGPAHENESGEDEAPVVLSALPSASSAEFQEGHIAALLAADGTILQAAGVLSAPEIQQLNLPAPGWRGVQQVSLRLAAGVESRQYLFASQAIQRDGQLTGYFVAGVPLDANHQQGRLLISLILGNLVTLVIALSGGFWLADQAMRPVHTITHTARQISETDLQKRLHLEGKDELSELANTFDAMLDRLEAAFERQRQFTANASHELRTPLTIIDLESTRALESQRSVEEYERILSTIKSENQFMTRLVNNLLALARMDAGQQALKPELLDLSDLVLQVVERLRPLADPEGVRLELEDLPELLIRGDPPTLTQMLTNLVENAIKYSASVSQPQVSVSSGWSERPPGRYAWVRVSDNGVGISPEHLSHIFDRFYQVETSRRRQITRSVDGNEGDSSGTGLGLAIAQWIAHAHGGEIKVESTLGTGSVFEVFLPGTLSH